MFEANPVATNMNMSKFAQAQTLLALYIKEPTFVNNGSFVSQHWLQPLRF